MHNLTCSVCGAEYPQADMRADGPTRICVTCDVLPILDIVFHARQTMRTQMLNRSKRPGAKRAPAPAGMKRCADCHKTKSLDAFHADNKRMDGHQCNCKTCGKIKRGLRRAGTLAHWPTIRAALRAAP